MVNTFLPVPDYAESAQILDYRRLGKQRVEALQIVKANLGLTKGWINHPAAVMWRGHEASLISYGAAMCAEWIARGYRDSCLPQFLHYMDILLVGGHLSIVSGPPPWLENTRFHESHQSNLLRKDPIYYGQYGWSVDDTLPYHWPGQP